MSCTQLAPVGNRETIRCDHCLLVQFRSVANPNQCRRCHESLEEEVEEKIPEPEVCAGRRLSPLPGLLKGGFYPRLAFACRKFRLGRSLSQRQLAVRMAVPRTYVSKIENDKAIPTLGSLERFASALETTTHEILVEAARPDAVFEQMIEELHPLIAGRSRASFRDLGFSIYQELKKVPGLPNPIVFLE